MDKKLGFKILKYFIGVQVREVWGGKNGEVHGWEPSTGMTVGGTVWGGPRGPQYNFSPKTLKTPALSPSKVVQTYLSV